MLRRTRLDMGTALRPAPRADVEASFVSQCLGEFLARVQRIDPHPAVLDLGVLCGGNIAFLGARGCRVSVESLPRAPAAGQPPAPKGARRPEEKDAVAIPATPVSPLSYPPESFSGILAWDAIARMPTVEATGFVETLRRLLLGGGVILAYFPGPPGQANGATGRYRISGENRVAVEPSAQRGLPRSPYQNREIYALFSRFDVVRLSHLKSGTREVLVAKSRRAGRS